MTTPTEPRQTPVYERPRIIPRPFPAADLTGMVNAGACRLFGLALVNSDAANVAAFQLLDGNDANGQLLLPGNIPASGSVRLWLGPHGLDVSSGLFQTSAATVSGVVWVEHRHRD